MPNPLKRAVYSDYLQLEKILGSQSPISTQKGSPVHEEHFFILIHQVYELWFKQIITDLDSIFLIFTDKGENRDFELILSRLGRIRKIFGLLIEQFDILETMSPQEFLNFRHYLNCMSGFQSYQFRMLEVKLGLKKEERMPYAQCPYDSDLTPQQQESLQNAEKQGSLFDHIAKWLSAFPYLENPTFNFAQEYKKAVHQLLEKEKCRIATLSEISEQDRTVIFKRLEEQFSSYEPLFNPNKYQELIAAKHRHLPYKAYLTALFIRSYKKHPCLHLPDLLLNEILELNSIFTLWRYRHSEMVRKMIGEKMGTGGSSGFHYLQETASKYNIFADLYTLPMVLIPQSYLPKLPEDLLPPINYFFTENPL